MTLADQIRQYVLQQVIEPARKSGAATVKVVAGDIHAGMKLDNRMPAVCDALDANIFLIEAQVSLARRDGPPQGTTAEWEFEIECLRFGGYVEPSLAKAIVFRSLAHYELANGNRIPAVITGYYAILHMTIALMFTWTQFLLEEHRQVKSNPDEKERKKKTCFDLAMENEDPSKQITHAKAKSFLKTCLSYGLPNKNQAIFNRGQEMREYVNYAPRVSFVGLDTVFGDCKYKTRDADQIVEDVDEFIFSLFQWGLKHQNRTYPLTMAILGVSRYITQKDLFYAEWVPEAVKNDCLEFIRKLDQLRQPPV